MEDFLIVPRSGRIAVPNPRARKDAWLAIDTGPTIGERAAAADAMRAWLESKPSLDEWQRQRTRERTLRRQQWWEQQKRRASSSPQGGRHGKASRHRKVRPCWCFVPSLSLVTR